MRKGSRGKKSEAKLSIVAQPADFFKQQLTKALEDRKVKVGTNTEFYLVDLMTRFMFSENLFAVGKDGERQQETLALLLNESLSASDPSLKQRGLKRLGDVSLYTAGFFSDSFSRRVVDVDYYIGMGRNAYGNLAQMALDALFRQMFVELSEQFHKFVDVLADISAQNSSNDAKNILRQYEVWLKTRSERAEKNLKDAGIIPNRVVKRDWQ